MSKRRVKDYITDQEIAFARLILSGTVTDRQAAETAGLHPDSAAYIKAKPRVKTYLLQRQAARNEHIEREETEGLRQQKISREQVLDRLWQIANLSPEATRNSLSAQIKALALIVAIEGLIPDRRAVPAAKKPAFPPVTGTIYRAEWLPEQQSEENAASLHPDPDFDFGHHQARPSVPSTAVANQPSDPEIAPDLVPEVPEAPEDSKEPTRHHAASSTRTTSSEPKTRIASPTPTPASQVSRFPFHWGQRN